MRKTGLLAAVAMGVLGWHPAARAQETAAPSDAVPPDAEGAAMIAAEAAELTVTTFVPADFARFAPRNALDMLGQVPGFAIRGDDQQRGLGQATGNVLINGARVSSKSDGLFDRLRRISTDRVERIELVDGATLGIPGLSGQVANIVTKPGSVSGRFEYRTSMRPRYARPSYFGGEVSVSGSDETLDWTLAYSHGVGRGAGGGGRAFISDPQGNVIENRDVVLRFIGDFPRLSGRVNWNGPGGIVANANASYSRRYTNFSDDEQRDVLGGIDLLRDFDNRDRGYGYELGGDITVPLAGGQLKLVGLERFNHNRGRSDGVFDYVDATPSDGSRFASISDSGERVGRAEYSWPMLGGTFQIDGEAAFNRLNRTASLFVLNSGGQLDEVPFPNASGGVTEDRYETILTHNRALATGLTLQIGAGAEFSTLAQTGPGGLTRHFQRPKGSLTLAWTPSQGRDLSFKLNRSVGQLSFGDFLANVSLQQDNQNAGNVQLVPPQSWEADLELRESLGPWGSTTVRLFGRWYEDFIEVIPVAGGLETNGNIDSARLYGLEWRTTLELSQMGWNGAKLDTRLNRERTRLRDPLTGAVRPFSGQYDISGSIDLRHDVPHSNWAWGAGLTYDHVRPYYRPSEVGRDFEGPIYTYAFIEHKDLFGLTANLQVFNLTNGNARFERTVWDGYRDRSPLVFSEYRSLSVQPILQFKLTGSF